MLGDNILEDDIGPYINAFEAQPSGARVLLKKVPDPERFGVPDFDGDRVVHIEEKPVFPKSDYAVIGIYMYDSQVFDFIKQLEPSERGELEITDVNNAYIRDGSLYYDVIRGWWSDAGTIEGLHRSSRLVASRRTRFLDAPWGQVISGEASRSGVESNQEAPPGTVLLRQGAERRSSRGA